MNKIYNQFKHSIIKNKFNNIFVPILIVIVLVSGYKLVNNNRHINKSELAYTDQSPAGVRGGSVMPASCDSYPDHSVCECNPNTSAPQTWDNPPTVTSCSFANGVGRLVRHCQGGENWTWVVDSCTLISCNAGTDLVTDSAGTRCQTSCTGNEYRTYTFTTVSRCVLWGTPSCRNINMKEDSNTFTKSLSIEHASAAICCEYADVSNTVASCAACPNGTVPNANHTSCVAPATPSVNVNLGN